MYEDGPPQLMIFDVLPDEHLTSNILRPRATQTNYTTKTLTTKLERTNEQIQSFLFQLQDVPDFNGNKR